MISARRKGRGVNEVVTLPDAKSVPFWEAIHGTAPHKVFLWDANGVYVDCSFRKPVNGHVGGDERILGLRVTDILPPKAAIMVLQGIYQALKTSKSRTIVMELRRSNKRYQATIQLFPMRHYVLGLVTDSPGKYPKMRKEHSIFVPRRKRMVKDQSNRPLTHREWEVLSAFAPGRSNQVIANRLGITERTVKFHFKSIFQKLQISSRVHLATLGLISPRDGVVLTDRWPLSEDKITS